MNQRVKVITAGDRTLRLVGGMLMYDSGQGDVYATTHPVEIDATNPARRVLGPGSALTKAALAKFAAAVDVATAFAGFVPSNLLYTSPNLLAWWVPAAIRKTWFKSTDEGIGSKSGPAAHPALVFIATPTEWFVFALKSSERPAPETRLYHAPHFNVWEDGKICTGNVKLPNALAAEVLGEYESAFFGSFFTHSNHQSAVKYKGGMRGLWKDQLDKPDPDAMVGALKSANLTLATAINQITTSN